MTRSKPKLNNWDDRRLRQVTTSAPEDWVGTVLNTFVPTGRLSGANEKPRVWTFGEIREAIRRELVRRGYAETKAIRLASIRTLRGLKALREKDALRETPAGYSIRTRWYWAEAIREVASELASGRSRLIFNITHLDSEVHALSISFQAKSGRSVTATIPAETG